MTTTHPVAQLRIARDAMQADALLDGVLLKQSGSLSALIEGRRDNAGSQMLDHSELMRLVKSRRSLLAAARDRASAGTMMNDAGALIAN